MRKDSNTQGGRNTLALGLNSYARVKISGHFEARFSQTQLDPAFSAVKHLAEASDACPHKFAATSEFLKLFSWLCVVTSRFT